MFLIKIIVLCLCHLTFANCCVSHFSWNRNKTEIELSTKIVKTETEAEVESSNEDKKMFGETPDVEMNQDEGSGDFIIIDQETLGVNPTTSSIELTTLYLDEDSTLMFLEEVEASERSSTDQNTVAPVEQSGSHFIEISTDDEDAFRDCESSSF